MYFFKKSDRIRINTIVLVLFSTIIPVVAFAATLDNVVATIGGIFKFLLPLVVGFALLYFFWGLGLFILHAGDEGKRAEGRQIMVWGIIALFVMVSVWGLVAVINATFTITPGGPAPLPTLPI